MSEEKVVVDIEKVLSYRTKEIETFLDSREPVLYALGLGFSEDPMNAKDLSFTYELHEDFKIFPTFACVINKENIFDYLMEIKGLP